MGPKHVRAISHPAAAHCLAGIDVGGTKMRMALVGIDGRLIGRVQATGANLSLEGVGQTAQKILGFVRAGAPEGSALAMAVIGIAGGQNTELARELAREVERGAAGTKVRVLGDVAALLEALPRDRQHVVVGAGTGAVALARDLRGRVHRVDGWGPWLGDAGSGYSIGRKALEYALAAHDGRAKPTPFTRAVLRHVGFRVPERDIAGFYARKNAQAEIASLVPLVVRAANRGDRMAKRLLDEAAESLAELARSALEKLASAPTSLLVGGGLVEAIPQLVERVQRRVRGNAKVARSELPADAACALLALEDAGHALEESERSRLVAAIGKEPARVLRAPRASRPRAPAQAEPALSSTEAQNPATERFSFQSAREMAELMNAEDRRVAPAVGAILDEVAAAIELCEKQLRAGGRLVYVGAGTSGRLGVLDASEIPPTFGEPPRTVQAVIAGGARAITHAVEGAEDRGEEGESAIRRLRIGRKDVVVGLSVSGGAAFVLHALAEARRRGASTIGITCNPRSELARSVHIALVPKVGPEVIAGSSRLKAGTAQKLLLNMLSTCTMARLGRVTGNLMTRVATTNQKLRLRATRIAAEVLGVPEREARRKLEESGWRLEAALRR